MKIKLLITIAFFTIQFARAQNSEVSIKAGMNLASIIGDGTKGLTSLPALHAGIFINYPINEQLSFQPEFMYSMQGYRLVQDAVQPSYEEKTFLNYINIPLVLKYKADARFTIVTGAQAGMFLGGKKVAKYGNVKEEGTIGQDDFSFFDLSVLAGAGYRLSNGIGISARYNFGLTNISKSGYIVNRNSVVQFSFSYLLKL